MNGNSYIALFCCILILLTFSNCSEEQQNQATSILKRTSEVAPSTSEFVESEAGKYLPGNLKNIIYIGGLMISGISNLLLSLLNNKNKKACEEIILGCEQMTKPEDFKTAHNNAQSLSTQKIVTAVKKSLNK